MIKGLTQRAQRIFTIIAQNEAKNCKAEKLQPEHILLGILKEGGGSACKLLRTLAIDTEAMHKYITKKIMLKRSGILIGDIPHSTRGMKVLEDAAEIARSVGSEYVGTEHLLLACIQEIDSITAKYLHKNSVSISILQEMIVKTQSQKKDKSKVVINYAHLNNIQKHSLKQTATTTKTTPTLREHATDLTQAAKEKKSDPVVGREKEVNRIVQILARRNKNNPILIGEPGVGKTAIVEGLAQVIVSNDAPEFLAEKRILSIDLPGLVAGTKYRGEFEDRLKKLMQEVRSNSNIILFIDEIHMLIGAGGAEGAIDAANMFKPALSRSDIQCIGATTFNEYKKHIEKDPALERRFQTIIVEEPTVPKTIEILMGIKQRYEEYHNVKYSKASLEAAAKYSKRYIRDRFLPDKAIDLIDEAGARNQIVSNAPPKNLLAIQQEITQLDQEKIGYVNAQNYERAAMIRDKIRTLKDTLEEKKSEWQKTKKDTIYRITETEILAVVSDMSGVPLNHLAKNEIEKLSAMESIIKKQVIGQSEAIDTISAAIKKSRVGLHSPHKPIGTFLFLGPTGVGKTHLAKMLGLFLFGSIDSIIRLDMSDYMEKHTVARLVGAPPGYVGYQEGGELTEKVRRKPYSIILFDEIEKAHNDFYNILLQIMEEGELQDNLGHAVSFHNAIIIITSNIGTRSQFAQGAMGFMENSNQKEYDMYKKRALEEIKNVFRPEFLNRIDAAVVFNPLGAEALEKVFNLLFAETQNRLTEQNIALGIQKSAQDFIITQGIVDGHGARPLRRLISKFIEEPISVEIINGKIGSGDTIVAQKKQNQIVFIKKNPTNTLIAYNTQSQ